MRFMRVQHVCACVGACGEHEEGEGGGRARNKQRESNEHFLNKHPGGRKYTGSEERGAENTNMCGKARQPSNDAKSPAAGCVRCSGVRDEFLLFFLGEKKKRSPSFRFAERLSF